MPGLTALLCLQQALSRCLVAASRQHEQGGADEEGALGLVQRLMFNLTKKGMTAASLAVRQVSLRCQWQQKQSLMLVCQKLRVMHTSIDQGCSKQG